MTRSTTLSLAVTAAMLLTVVPGTNAMSWSRVASTEEIAKTSAAGFRGTVIEQSFNEVNINGNPFPYTETTFHITDCLYGCPANDEIVIRQMGGLFSSRKDRAMLVPGLAQYEVGDDYFVFAGGANDDLFGSRLGEHGSLPLVKLEGGQAVVASHAGALLQLSEDGQALAHSDLLCESLDKAGICSNSAALTKQANGPVGLSADDFANFVRRIVTSKSQPASTISDRNEFETALATFAGLSK